MADSTTAVTFLVSYEATRETLVPDREEGLTPTTLKAVREKVGSS